MHSVNAREARKHLGHLLTEAEQGETISITRRGKEVARLVPPEQETGKGFPDMCAFRDSIAVRGKATSELISQLRDEEQR